MKHLVVATAVAWMTFILHTPAQGAAIDPNPPVTINQNSDFFILNNGHIAATISKASGEILSLKFEGRELLADAHRVAPGTWFNTLASGAVTDRIMVDPSGNQGAGGKVSISVSGPLAIDIRYALARGGRALYLCQILNHPANLPSAQVFGGGFQLRLNPNLFDHLTVSKTRSHDIPSPQDWTTAKAIISTEARQMTTGKFAGQLVCFWDDAATQRETPVYGFSGAKAGVGLWIINPSSDYLSRGGNVIAPTGWLDSMDGVPTLLNRWGGESRPLTGVPVVSGASWSHVIGPFLLYCNQGSFQDAQSRATREMSQWPYTWAAPDESLPRPQRAALSGQIVLSQSPLATTAYSTSPPLTVQPASALQSRFGAESPTPSDVPTTRPQALTQLRGAIIGLSFDLDWQTNFFDDQVWTRARDDGTFSFANVLPGTYTLHVYCDGQMGEASLPGIQVSAGQNLNIGKIAWTPRAYGEFVWQLGYPDRSAAKFRHGHDPSRWGLWTLDPREFPNGVNYFIGKSDPQTDWNFAQAPGTTWTVHFSLGFIPYGGFGFLQIALAGGSGQASLGVSMNGNDISRTLRLPNPAIPRPPGAVLVDDIAHDQVSGISRVNLYGIPLRSVRLGDNILRLRVNGSRPTDGIMYDALRMEIFADSSQMGTTGQPDDPKAPGLMRGHSGFDFGQSYKGDPSGNYTALSRVPNGTAP
jgi:rhamnogalacturonan endolyase